MLAKAAAQLRQFPPLQFNVIGHETDQAMTCALLSPNFHGVVVANDLDIALLLCARSRPAAPAASPKDSWFICTTKSAAGSGPCDAFRTARPQGEMIAMYTQAHADACKRTADVEKKIAAQQSSTPVFYCRC